MCRPTARSTAAPSTLEAVFQLAVPSPMTARPTATATGVARTDVPNPAMARPQPTMMAPARMVRLEPSRRTINPEAETETKDPRVMHSSSNPTLPGVSSSPSRIAGRRDTHEAKASPLAP